MLLCDDRYSFGSLCSRGGGFSNAAVFAKVTFEKSENLSSTTDIWSTEMAQ
jgi:hypothetical protein